MPTATLDQKRRLVLPESQSGEVYHIDKQQDGKYSIVRLMKPTKSKVKSQAVVRKLLKAKPLTPKMDWDTLKAQTRELED